MKKSTSILLAVLIAVCTVSGIWLLIFPSWERQHNLEVQEEMIERIETGFVEPVSEPLIEKTEPTSTSITIVEPEQPKEPVPIGTELGILVYERLNMKLPIVEGVAEELIKSAVGHVSETAAIGDMGNAVILGHRNYTYGSHFNRLGEAEIGDLIGYTSADGESCLFEVFEIIEIEPNDQIAFVQPTERCVITLYTCTPIYEATHRLLVRAEKINELEECY